ncbi:MAG: HAD-IB family phosphatase [Planctomycetes bacterium]|nr:HAD-IB family phosphatase [Planctomycetota bacterium]
MAPTPFRSIWFDCDSTLSRIEGIDELARDATPAIRDEIRELTDAAMDGEIPLGEVYGRRLEIMRPSRAQIERIARAYVEEIVPNTREVIAALHELGKQVGIISGGLLPAVLGLAGHLGVPSELVFAVDVTFDDDGGYRDYDRNSPLARNGGKPEILASIDPSHRPAAFVGDGVTDLEAAPVVERFIGFGGVAKRDKVVRGAEHFAAGPGLDSVLQFCLTPAEVDRLARHPDYRGLIA